MGLLHPFLEKNEVLVGSRPMAKSNQSRFLLIKLVLAFRCPDKADNTQTDVHPITPRP